jgi:1,4-alpha-glucan branching enzyme
MIRRQSKGEQIRVTFVLPDASSVGKVSVVGDFNEWQPGRHTLIKRTNGTRSVAISLEPGSVQRFRYLAEGGHWFDDPDADLHTHEGGIIHV